MKRRGFLKNAALAGTAAMLPSAILEANGLTSGKSEASSTNAELLNNPGKAANTAIDRDLRIDYAALMSCWKENRRPLVEWIDSMITSIAKKAADNKIVCGNTEGWGPIGWYDHPDLPWDWVKESAEICVDLA